MLRVASIRHAQAGPVSRSPMRLRRRCAPRWNRRARPMRRAHAAVCWPRASWPGRRWRKKSTRSTGVRCNGPRCRRAQVRREAGMTRVLVTGAGGFIGSHLVRYLKRAGYWVRGVDLEHPEFAPSEADEFELHDL